MKRIDSCPLFVVKIQHCTYSYLHYHVNGAVFIHYVRPSFNTPYLVDKWLAVLNVFCDCLLNHNKAWNRGNFMLLSFHILCCTRLTGNRLGVFGQLLSFCLTSKFWVRIHWRSNTVRPTKSYRFPPEEFEMINLREFIDLFFKCHRDAYIFTLLFDILPSDIAIYNQILSINLKEPWTMSEHLRPPCSVENDSKSHNGLHPTLHTYSTAHAKLV